MRSLGYQYSKKYFFNNKRNTLWTLVRPRPSHFVLLSFSLNSYKGVIPLVSHSSETKYVGGSFKEILAGKNWWGKKKKAFKICWWCHSHAFASKLATGKGHCEETRGNTVFMGTSLSCQCHVLCFLCRGFYLKQVQQAEWVFLFSMAALSPFQAC